MSLERNKKTTMFYGTIGITHHIQCKFWASEYTKNLATFCWHIHTKTCLLSSVMIHHLFWDSFHQKACTYLCLYNIYCFGENTAYHKSWNSCCNCLYDVVTTVFFFTLLYCCNCWKVSQINYVFTARNKWFIYSQLTD